MRDFKSALLIIVLIISFCSCKKDSSNPKVKKYEVSNCFVQKGPFVQGSGISIIELNDNFEPSGSVFNTETKDDLGSFSISALLNSKFVEINANGYYFNEVSGKIDGPISLKVFTDLSSVNSLNINILTLLAKDRIKQLMIKDRKEYAEAKKQAEGEILHIFNIPDEIAIDLVNFDKMDISANNQSAAVLLAISITVQGQLSAGELSELLAKISNDIADNGVLDNKDIKTKINNNGRSLYAENIKNNIINRYSDLNLDIIVAPFEKYIDINGNRVIDCYDVKPNTPNGTIFNLKPEFIWFQSEKPSIEYQFQISSDEAFSSIIEDMSPRSTTSYQLKTSLEYNEIYYWRVATIDVKTGSKSWTPAVQITPKTGIISLITSGVTMIGANSAFCGGTIINDGGGFITESGVVYSTDSNPTTNNNKIAIGNGIGIFTYELTGLTTNTSYHLKVYAINSVGTFYGEEVVFTTQSGIISLITSPAIGIGANSAVFEGIVKSIGGYKVTERGLVFSNIPNPNTSNTKVISTKRDSFSIDPGEYRFKNIITGLTATTTYYVRAYATNRQNTYYGDEVSFITTSGGLTGTVTDIDGNIYPTVTIGTQVWMGENLKTTKYRNGDPIPNVTDKNSWGNLTSGAYCNYDNELSFANTYGRLYNGYAVSDSRSIAPTGWHVPNEAEWKTLANYLGNDHDLGGKLREFGVTHWDSNDIEVTNESGFTCLPGGAFMNGKFGGIGSGGMWWISEMSINTSGWNWGLSGSYFNHGPYLIMVNGFSIRCIKD